MSYKFVTREDLFREDLFKDLKPWTPELVMLIVDRILSERDAYREVGIRNYLNANGVTSFDAHGVWAKWVDAEAARIIEENK